MKLQLNEAQMLDLWRRQQGMLPLRDDLDAVRTDGLDFTPRLKAEMDAWYLRLLETAPAGLLAPEDCHELEGEQVAGAMVVELPRDTVRILGVKLSGWKCSASVTDDPCSPLARSQRCALTRACAEAPVAVWDRAAGTLSLYPAVSDDLIVQLDLVVRREGEYSFDRAALFYND